MYVPTHNRNRGDGGGSTPPPPVISAPTNLTATVVTSTKVNLAWTDNTAGVAEYEIYRNGTLINTTAAGATSYSATGLTVNTHYAFLVRAKVGTDFSSAIDAAAMPAYQYGYPAFAANGTEPNVAAQWTFQESSGDIIDEVAALHLVPTVSGATSGFAYGVAAYADPGDMSPSIFTSRNSFFYTTDTSLVIGTGDAVIEWVIALMHKNDFQSGNSPTVFITIDDSALHGILFDYPNITSATPDYEFYVKCSDGTLSYKTGDLVSSAFATDGKFHKHRLVINRAGNAEYFIDGVSQFTHSLAAISGKTIECSQFALGSASSTGLNMMSCIWKEFRFTIGNATNNSGGPGGG